MAFAPGTLWFNWSTGATGNGGGFDPTNANFLTDLAATSGTGNSPVVTSASYTFVANDVGSWLFIQGGTNWAPGWYQIASVSAGAATLSAAIGQATKYGTDAVQPNYLAANGANIVAGCATTASPTGGTWSIDYSQQTTAEIAYTDIVIDGTTNTDATSAAAPFGKQMLGNIINITAGTGFNVQRVQLTSIPSGVVGRFDKSLGTLSSTGGTGSFGGAVGSSSVLTALSIVSLVGRRVYIKATGTYTETATTTVSPSTKGDITNGRVVVEGYTTTPGALDGRPLITTSTTNTILLTFNDNDFFEIKHLKFTNTTGGTKAAAIRSTGGLSTPFWATDCIFDGVSQVATSNGVQGFSNLHFENSEVANCSAATTIVDTANNPSNLYFFGCDIHDNVSGYIMGNVAGMSATFDRCLFDTNAIAISIATTSVAAVLTVTETTFVDQTGDDIKFAANSASPAYIFIHENNIHWGSGGADINNLDEQASMDANCRINRNNASGNNTNARVGFSYGKGDVTLSSIDPFVSRSGRDFRPNTVIGGGALIRNAGFPGAFASGTTTSYMDIGAVQHQDQNRARYLLGIQ